MAAWILVPCLATLRAEFNTLNPNRDKASDGSIGDLAHQDSPSDHNPDETGETPYEDDDSTNEVHAVDIDKTGPWLPIRPFDVSVEIIRKRHQTGDDNRLQNIIWNGRIASRTWGWQWRKYTGPNQHTQHAHFSARYSAAQERDTRPWGIVPDWSDMATEAQIRDLLRAELARFKAEWQAQQQPPAPGDNNVWDDGFGRGEYRMTAGQILVETRDNVRAIREAVAPQTPPTDPPPAA